MRGVFFLAALTAAIFAPTGRAWALAEFCPASISDPHALPSDDGALYSATLGAESSRTVVANVEAQTENGWYTVALPATVITQQEVTYATSLVTFTRKEANSGLLYVTFPKEAGKLLRWWVADAKSAGDQVMGWDTRGDFVCLPPATISPEKRSGRNDRYAAKRVGLPEIDYDRVPLASDTIVKAVPGAAAQDLDCLTPFAQSSVTKTHQPEWPLGIRIPEVTETLIRVVVDTGGNLADAWIFQPSGVRELDSVALDAARRSSYAAGVAFCHPTPGDYLFRAEFKPN